MATRVVTGVKCMENNRDVSYKGSDGKPVGFRTNDGLINGLIGHAGNRTIPAHLTHDWTDGKKDALHSRVGGVKNFRRDENGALLADYYAMPGVEGDKILWLAENDPEHAMLSLVFDYNKIVSDGVTYAVPLNFESADFVARGAAVSAMLSQLNTDTDMTKEEIQTLVAEGVKAALKDYKPEGFITVEESDKRISAKLADFKPEKAVLSDAEMDALLVKAEAKFTKAIGSGPLLQNLKQANEAADNYTATLAKFTETHPNKASAIRAMLSKHPELGSVHEEHLQLEIAKAKALN